MLRLRKRTEEEPLARTAITRTASNDYGSRREATEGRLSDGREEGYADGRADGHEEGYDEGFETGRSEIGSASEDAHDREFSDGKEAGLARGKRLGNYAGWSEGCVDGCVSTFDDLSSSRVYDEGGYWYLDCSSVHRLDDQIRT